MPSPFPGMDPYLELPEFFPDFHDGFVACVREALQARLPPPYYAAIGSRIWVEQSRRPIEPDVNVLRPDLPAGHQPDMESGGVLTEVIAEPIVVTVPHDEHRDTYIDIYSPVDGERLVTTVEVLSLTNKTPGQRGQDLYLRKQQEIIYGQVHLIEIDLLRAGQHTTAVPADLLRARCGPFDYHVVTHRFDNLEDFFVYPIQLPQKLPTIAVPLLPGDPDVPLDLQAVFNRNYDSGPYRRRIRYRERTPAGLTEAQAAWTAERVAQIPAV